MVKKVDLVLIGLNCTNIQITGVLHFYLRWLSRLLLIGWKRSILQIWPNQNLIITIAFEITVRLFLIGWNRSILQIKANRYHSYLRDDSLLGPVGPELLDQLLQVLGGRLPDSVHLAKGVNIVTIFIILFPFTPLPVPSTTLHHLFFSIFSPAFFRLIPTYSLS